jgi:signal recognition particle subunit SRP54
MFNTLSTKFSDIFGRLKKRGVLTEADVDATLREIRVALLEADVALPVVKEFTAGLKEKIIGQKVIESVSPAQMVVKLTQDHLTELLGSENTTLNLNATPPAVVLMCGLQGSGKTTTTGKLAYRLREKHGKKVLVASLDIYRPAAQEQLRQVAERAGVTSLPIIEGQQPLAIAERALTEAKLGGFDVLMLDTAGRLHVDAELMAELKLVNQLTNPVESLLIADSLTGQDAVNIAKSFHENIGITGIILTRIDGDARGGAALSMRSVTGAPIKFLGAGEKITELEEFHPDRIASRILDMGDVVSLVEKAAEMVTKEEAEKMAERMLKGKFDMTDLLEQMRKMRKMGGVSSMLGFLPGIGKIKEQLENANIDEKVMKRQEAIILSMTTKERQFPKTINGARRIRIAKGSGTQVQDVNKLLKQFVQMEDMMKKMKKMGEKGMARGGMQALMGKGFR